MGILACSPRGREQLALGRSLSDLRSEYSAGDRWSPRRCTKRSPANRWETGLRL
jgi:hypothetical protein